MKKPLHVGLIGPGEVADKFLIPALRQVPGADFWSALGKTREKTDRFFQTHQGQRPDGAYEDLEELLDDDSLDAVIIASPDALHAEQAIAAAKVGKHVFIEKPMATSAPDAKRVVDAVQENSVVASVGYHLRWHEGHKLLRKKIRDDVLGNIHALNVHWTYPIETGNWRNGSGLARWFSLGALGTHCIDLALWLTDGFDKIEEMYCDTANAHAGKHDESAAIHLRLSTGAMIRVFVSTLFHSERRLEVYGSKDQALALWTLGPQGKGTITLGKEALAFDSVNPYREELAHFISSITHRTRSEVDDIVGLTNVELLERLTST